MSAPKRELREPAPADAARVELEVPFHDVDPLLVAWHGHYFKYFEIARTALQRRHRLDAPDLRELGFVWFVIESRVRHVAPLRYGERFAVAAWFSETDPRIGIDYEITTLDAARRVARARTILANATPQGELLLETPRAVLDRITRAR